MTLTWWKKPGGDWQKKICFYRKCRYAPATTPTRQGVITICTGGIFLTQGNLLCLGLLLKKIQAIKSEVIRDQFLCLFSSTLEFNNLFCSFKGEGTGAVRHTFSHHILKPERTPLENSVWGTSKSSGTFASLFKSRLLKAKTYLQTPSEIYFPEDMFGSMEMKSRYLVASDPVKLKITNFMGRIQSRSKPGNGAEWRQRCPANS